MADKAAPFLEVGRFTEIDGMVLQRPPAHEQAIAARLLVRALQFHALAALRAPKDGDGLPDSRLEVGLQAGPDLELRDLQDHRAASRSTRQTVSSHAGLAEPDPGPRVRVLARRHQAAAAATGISACNRADGPWIASAYRAMGCGHPNR